MTAILDTGDDMKINPEYLQIQESSGDMALRLVQEILPETEHQNEFAFLVRDSESLDWGRSRVASFCVFAYVFAMVKQWKNSPEIQKSALEPKNLTKMVVRLHTLENLELFKQVDESVQTSIHGFPSHYSESVEVYLRCAKKLNLQSLRLDGNSYAAGGLTRSEEKKILIDGIYNSIIGSIVRDDQNTDSTSQLCIEPLSDRMLDTISDHHRMRTFYSADIPVLIFWKILYGEDVVFDCLERYSLPDVIVSPSDFMSLLEDWEEIKSFPASWIVHVRGFKVIQE